MYSLIPWSIIDTHDLNPRQAEKIMIDYKLDEVPKAEKKHVKQNPREPSVKGLGGETGW